ncbi:MAG: hypothetical protein ACI97K_002004 [Glaciecola sp.]|jgi:hypothetical protein
MNISTKVVLALCCLCITFVAGYLAGSLYKPDFISTNPRLHKLNLSDTKIDKTALFDKTYAFSPASSLPSAGQSSQVDFEINSNDSEDANSRTADLEQEQTEKDIITLFSEFATYAASGSDYSEYGMKLDDIRDVLIASSSDLAVLLEYLQQLPIDSQENYLLVSIIMGLPQEISQPAMLSVMDVTLLNDDPNNATNFLELAARTGLKSPNIITSLKDIAIFSENNDQTLRALDMLMPYELSSIENQQIRDRLLRAAQNSKTEDKPHYFSQLLRFSNSAQRQQLALDAFNQTEANKGIQSIIMDSIQAGTLDRSSDLKEVLYSIAKQQENDLQQQAIYTLLYRFDLTQEEYKDLSEGKNIETNNIYDSVN